MIASATRAKGPNGSAAHTTVRFGSRLQPRRPVPATAVSPILPAPLGDAESAETPPHSTDSEPEWDCPLAPSEPLNEDDRLALLELVRLAQRAQQVSVEFVALANKLGPDLLRDLAWYLEEYSRGDK
jgi:hypothetical protein